MLLEPFSKTIQINYGIYIKKIAVSTVIHYKSPTGMFFDQLRNTLFVEKTIIQRTCRIDAESYATIVKSKEYYSIIVDLDQSG